MKIKIPAIDLVIYKYMKFLIIYHYTKNKSIFFSFIQYFHIRINTISKRYITNNII